MALVLADRVQDLTTTTGTGTITLANTPPAGYQSFGAAIGNGNTTYYVISGGTEWEVGIGTYTAAGTSLSRDTVLSSSNSGSLVNFSAGTKIVFVTYPAEKSVNKDVAGNVNISITGNAATATTATNLAAGAAGSIPYQTAANTTAFVATAAGVLVGGTTPSFSTTPTLTGTNFSSIPNGALSNSAVTIGSTSVSLGATATTLAGLTSVTLTQDPSLALEAATKQYVDSIAAEGVSYHTPVKYEAVSALTATYNNGTAGVGATLTNAGTQTAFTPDGVVAQVGDRILIYNQANQVQNGVYTVTTVGSGSTNWVLTRATDANSYGVKDPNKLGAGDAFFVTSGDTGAGETYVCNTAGTITFGTTNITFVQVSAAQIYSAGTGLTLTGTQFSLTSPVATTLGGTGLTTFGAANRAIYSSGTTTLTAGTLPTAAGGTGHTTYTDGQILIGKSSDGSLEKATITAGTSISVTNGSGAITITNTAPDQVVSLTGGGTTVITGSYPNFNITSADQYVGTVTSVSATTDTVGTDVAVAVTNATTTPAIAISIPSASASARGALTSSDWSTFNAKQTALVSGTNIKTINGSSILGSGDLSTLNTPLAVVGNSTAGAEIRLPEDTDNGSNYVALKAPDTLASNLTLTLPTADGTSGQVLQTNGSGQLSFTTPASGGSQQFTASGAISAGAPVAFKSTGVVEAITQVDTNAITSGPASPGTAVGSFRLPTSAYDAANDRYIMGYVNSSGIGYVVAGTVVSGTLSWGTPVSLGSTCYGAQVVYSAAQSTVIVVYNVGGTLYAASLAGTGTTVSVNAATTLTTFNGSNDDPFAIAYSASNTRAYVTYYETNQNILAGRSLTPSGSTITAGFENSLYSSWNQYGVRQMRLAPNVSGNTLMFVGLNNDGGYLRSLPLYPSGTSISAGSLNNAIAYGISSAISVGSFVFEPRGSYYLLSWADNYNQQQKIRSVNSSGSGYNDLDTTSTVGWNSAAPANLAFYYDANVNLVRTFTISGGQYCIGSVVTDGSGNITFTVGSGLFSAGVSSGNKTGIYNSNNTWFTSNATLGGTINAWSYTPATSTSNYLNYIGISTQTVTNGQSVIVTTGGGVNTNVSGLTAGSTYAVSSTGALVASNTNFPRAGRALTTTSLLVEDRAALLQPTKTWTQILSTSTYTVPSGVTSIRVYAFGGGGDGYGVQGYGGKGGGGGGCAFGDVAVVPGQTFTITISSKNVTITRSGVTLFTANAGVDGSSGGAGGSASISGFVANGGAYSGGSSASGTTQGSGGASSGSPLGAGVAGGSNGGGGAGWGGGGGQGSASGNYSGGGGGGVGGAGSGAGGYSGGGGGTGGAAPDYRGGIGRTPITAFTDPLLAGLDSAGPSALQSGITGNPGTGGAGGGYSSIINNPYGGNGGFGGGGGGAGASGNTAYGGSGGFGGGGGGSLTNYGYSGGGSGGYGGGGGGGNSYNGSAAGGGGGGAIVLIYA